MHIKSLLGSLIEWSANINALVVLPLLSKENRHFLIENLSHTYLLSTSLRIIQNEMYSSIYIKNLKFFYYAN